MAPERNLLKRTRTSSDFWGGIAMIAIALFAFYASRDLPGMSGFSFGSGTPRLAGLLLALGVISWRWGSCHGPRFQTRLPRPSPGHSVHPVLALAIRPLGLVIVFVMFVFAAPGRRMLIDHHRGGGDHLLRTAIRLSPRTAVPALAPLRWVHRVSGTEGGVRPPPISRSASRSR
jgi:putative tricarboxylic transport membrane protein